MRVDQAVKARIELMRGSKVVSRVSARLRAGTNVKRLRARSSGRHVVRLVLMENGSKRTIKPHAPLLGRRMKAAVPGSKPVHGRLLG